MNLHSHIYQLTEKLKAEREAHDETRRVLGIERACHLANAAELVRADETLGEERRLREAAEARVRELEAKIETITNDSIDLEGALRSLATHPAADVQATAKSALVVLDDKAVSRTLQQALDREEWRAERAAAKVHMWWLDVAHAEAEAKLGAATEALSVATVALEHIAWGALADSRDTLFVEMLGKACKIAQNALAKIKSGNGRTPFEALRAVRRECDSDKPEAPLEWVARIRAIVDEALGGDV